MKSVFITKTRHDNDTGCITEGNSEVKRCFIENERKKNQPAQANAMNDEIRDR